jgi:hypothetical protein
MAYATGGSGGTLNDLMDALRGFCAGLGWTIDKYDAVAKLLFMTKGLCSVTMWWGDVSTVPIWSGPNNGGASVNTIDGRIYMALNESNNAALATYHSHPGSVVTSNFDTDAPMVNGLSGNYVAWHFFADPAVSDHVHVVVQKTADIYRHFSFGHVDQKGLTHSGVAYVTATPNKWYRDVNQYNPSNGNSRPYNQPSWQALPFVRNRGYQFGQGTANDEPSIMLKNSDAWPAAWTAAGVNVVGANGATPHFRTMLGLMGDFANPNSFPDNAGTGNHLLDMIVISEPMPFSNVVPMFPVPVFRSYFNSLDNSKNALCYLGDFPNVRALNMTNMLPGQEIDLTGDTWKVFPALRQENWAMNGSAEKASSGQFAVAYKKVP